MRFLQFLIALSILFLMTSVIQFFMIGLKIFGQLDWEWIYICSPFLTFMSFSIFAFIFKIISLLVEKQKEIKNYGFRNFDRR